MNNKSSVVFDELSRDLLSDVEDVKANLRSDIIRAFGLHMQITERIKKICSQRTRLETQRQIIYDELEKRKAESNNNNLEETEEQKYNDLIIAYRNLIVINDTIMVAHNIHVQAIEHQLKFATESNERLCVLDIKHHTFFSESLESDDDDDDLLSPLELVSSEDTTGAERRDE